RRVHGVVVVPRVADVDAAARLIEALAQRRRAHVPRAGRAEADLVVDRPVQAELPRPDVAAARVVGPARRRRDLEILGKARAAQYRNVQLAERFTHVVAALDLAQAAEQHRARVVVAAVAGWNEPEPRHAEIGRAAAPLRHDAA